MAGPSRSRDGAAQLDLRGSMWNVHVGVAQQPRARLAGAEERLRLLEDEAAVQDLLVRYTYFYDAKDVAGLLTVFHEECVLINPRGTYIGHEAIRRNYLYLMEQSKVCLHLAPNVAVRIAADRSEAWMTAYYYDISATRDGRLIGTGGTYADRLVVVGDAWKIAARRITYNFRHVLTPEAPGRAAPPTPTKPETSRDIVGPEAEM